MKIYTNAPEKPLHVLNMLKRAQKGQRDPNGKKIRAGLIVGGGALSTAWGAGFCCGLQKTGLHKHFKVIVGISGGAPIGVALNIDQSDKVPMVYEGLVDDMQFINMRRWGKFMDHDYLFELLRKLFPDEVFCQGPAELHAIVTKYPSGESDLLKLDIDVMRATTAIPLPWFCEPVDIGGTLYVDGACCRVPLHRIIEQFDLTDVIYLGSRPHRQDTPAWKRHMYWYSTHAALFYNAPPAIRHGIADMDIATEQVLEEMQTITRVRCTAFIPSYHSAIPPLPGFFGIWPFERMDAETVRQAVARGEASFNRAFDLIDGE